MAFVWYKRRRGSRRGYLARRRRIRRRIRRLRRRRRLRRIGYRM